MSGSDYIERVTEKVSSLEPANSENRLNYLNLAGSDKNAVVTRETLSAGSIAAMAALPELALAGVEKTSKGMRVEANRDGSRVEFDAKTGKPVFARDTKGNEYIYKWENGTSAPSYVSMQGPRTAGQLVEFKRNTVVDNLCQAAPGLIFTPALLMPHTRYGVWVDGREQQASLSLGAGVGVSAEGAGVSAGMSMPLQRGINLKINHDGSLVLCNPAETIQGTVQNRYTLLTLHLDGSTTMDSYSGWIFQDHSRVRRDPQGRVIR
jgi:hypothetical protein